VTLADPARVKLADALKRGFAFSATCSQQCTLTAELVLAKSAARKLGLGNKAVTVASGSARGTGTVRGTLRFTKKAKSKLRRARNVKLTLAVTSGDVKTQKAVTLR
jgi:hypothetical protein